jgi:hypothetical protein
MVVAGTLAGDELSFGVVGGSALETEYEAEAQSLGDALECANARLVAPALDARDRGVAGADTAGQFLLGKPERSSVLDHEAGDLFELSEATLLGTVGKAERCSAAPRLRASSPSCIRPRHRSSSLIRYLISSDKAPLTQE